MSPVSFRAVPLARVRALIAQAMLEPPDAVPAQLGTIILRDHQRRAAGQLVSMISRQGGALLAEPVGLGKTFSALAVAAQLAGDLLIAAPAALRGMWEQALRDCRMTAAFITHEALSRGVRPADMPSLVIVDEAHRLRSPSARRYDAVAAICRRARVLLVTATPVQNRRDDLVTQLALFLGRRAWSMTDEELSTYVVRGDAAESPELPDLSGPHSRFLALEDDCLDEILAIPPPVPTRDGSVAASLLAFGLVHQWTSSRAALIAALKRRRARGLALASALESGRRPTRLELSAWTHGEGSMQLAFPELVMSDSTSPDLEPNADDLLRAISKHDDAIERLLAHISAAPDPDDERASMLRAICAAHPGERVIAFCQYAETVNAIRARLMHVAGVAALTAAGARIASGRVSRDIVLRQFTPSAERGRQVGRADRVDLLLTTDLLSEGLNLQEASVIVHLDLPWNPARLEQRVGRVRRLGSRFRTVTVYTIAPPASANRLLRLEERLREKIKLAQRTVGIAGHILPAMPLALTSPREERERGLAESHAIVRGRLAAWRGANDAEFARQEELLVAGVAAPCAGFLALVRTADGVQLLGKIGSMPEPSSTMVAESVSIAGGAEAAIDGPSAESAIAQLQRWLAAEHAASMIDIGAATTSRARRQALSRVAQALARAPRHRRALLAPLANAARAAAIAPLAEGAERILDMLATAELPDEAWLRSIAAFGQVNSRARPTEHDGPSSSVIAVILFMPGPSRANDSEH